MIRIIEHRNLGWAWHVRVEINGRHELLHFDQEPGAAELNAALGKLPPTPPPPPIPEELPDVWPPSTP
jgi:hypothetical protein